MTNPQMPRIAAAQPTNEHPAGLVSMRHGQKVRKQVLFNDELHKIVMQ
jgi:hypothetical protein